MPRGVRIFVACTPVIMLPSSTCSISGFVTSVGIVSDNVLDGVGLDDTILVVISSVQLACTGDAIDVISVA